MYAKLKDGLTIDKYPYTMTDLFAEHPNTTFAYPITPELLSQFNVVVVAGSTPVYDPSTQYLEEAIPALIGTVWTQQWNVRDYDASTIASKKNEDTMSIESTYINAMENFYDTKAQEKRYDNRYTCALRAGYPGPFQAEGLAFAQWMDNCNEMGYQILTEVLSGERAQPTVDELLAGFPQLVWPD
jgi:hypothetical protein